MLFFFVGWGLWVVWEIDKCILLWGKLVSNVLIREDFFVLFGVDKIYKLFKFIIILRGN